MNIPIVSSPDYFDFFALVGEIVKNPRKALLLTNSVVDKTNEVVTREVDEALDTASHPFQNIIREQEEELQSVYGSLGSERAENDRLRSEVEYLRKNDPHEILVNVARTDEQVLTAMRGDAMSRRKIEAIKRLRALTGAGLKAAKEAVEDPRVNDAANPMFDVYAVVMVDTTD